MPVAVHAVMVSETSSRATRVSPAIPFLEGPITSYNCDGSRIFAPGLNDLDSAVGTVAANP